MGMYFIEIILLTLVLSKFTKHMNGIPQYHAWNMPVSCMDSACTMHGIHLYHAWNMPYHAWNMSGTCKFHAWNVHIFHAWNMHEACMKFRYQSVHVTCMSPYLPNPCMLHTCFRNHACNMHAWKFQTIQYCYWKFHPGNSGFGRVKCAETCMFQALHFE